MSQIDIATEAFANRSLGYLNVSQAASAFLFFGTIVTVRRYQIDGAIRKAIGMRVRGKSFDALNKARLGIELFAYLVPILNLGIGDAEISACAIEDH